MLALAFHVGKDRFALRCADVVEVVPRVDFRDTPHAPPWIPGMFTYRGAVVPVVDLCKLMWGAPCEAKMSSRIILVRHVLAPHRSPAQEPMRTELAPPARSRLIGLLAERVTEAVMLDTSLVAEPGVESPDAPYLGEVYFEAGKMIQLVRLEQLFQSASKSMILPEAQP